MRQRRPAGRENAMKKLFGVMFLAGLPMACGSSMPSAPDAVSSGALGGGTVPAAPARTRTDPTPIKGIQVSVVRTAPGYVRVQAVGLVLGSNNAPPVCMSPTWTVTPQDRDITITADFDSRNARLLAPGGEYVVAAEIVNGTNRVIRGSLTVKVPETDVNGR